MDLMKVNKLQMYFWFSVTVITLIMVIILHAQGSIENWYYMVPVICLLMALLRRWLYKRLQKSAAEREANKKK